jgi:CheY-like chemotaxis protein
VLIISADPEPENALKQGAIAFLNKPLQQDAIIAVFDKIRHIHEQPVGSLLVVEDDEQQRNSIHELIGNETAHLVLVESGEKALAALDNQHFDCVVVDLLLPDMSGFDLIEEIRARYSELPIIVYTGKDLSQDEEKRLNHMAQTIIVKDVRSPERLYDQTALWLHREVSRLPAAGRQIIQKLNDPNALLEGKKVLIVDDDIRNIFAMTSLLERHKMEILSAERGQHALEIIQEVSGIDVVLMDIMMPEMDGYEIMGAIRNLYGFKELPIIALTAKAMKGDREKCIEAGASDYISKPVDTDRLLLLLRTWLYR